jgi:hypothetical protein
MVVVVIIVTIWACGGWDLVGMGRDICVVKQVSAFVLGELVRQKCECYMVHIAYIYRQ